MKPIPGYEGLYSATKDGKIWSHYTNKWRKQSHKDERYMTVILSKDCKKKMEYVHRLIGKTFIKNPEGYGEINHMDNNTTNNNFKNLEWCNSSMNIKHAYDTGRRVAARSVYLNGYKKRKLTWEQANIIRKLWESGGWTQRELGKAYGMTHKNILWLVKNRTYKTETI